jgi:hypothetical protein
VNIDKLGKILGLLGSAHDGEVVNAGRMAHEMVRAAKTTWSRILSAGRITPEADSLKGQTQEQVRSVRERERLKRELEKVHDELEKARVENDLLRAEIPIAESVTRLKQELAARDSEIAFLVALDRPLPEWREPVDEDEQIRLCLAWAPAYLDSRYRQFIISISAKKHLTKNQSIRLWQMVLALRTLARRLGATPGSPVQRRNRPPGQPPHPPAVSTAPAATSTARSRGLPDDFATRNLEC